MEFLTNTKIPFLRYRKFFIWVSIALLVATGVEFFLLGGLNFGIDFAGGTQLTVKFDESVGVDQIRSALGAAGQRDAQIQQYGPPENHEVLIKTPVKEGSEEGSSKELLAALNEAFNPDRGDNENDLNQRGTNSIATVLKASDPDGLMADDVDAANAHYEAIANAVVDARQRLGLFTTWEQLQAVDGLSSAAYDEIRDGAYLGSYVVRSNQNVGPQIGKELRTKGALAVVLSLIGMLTYIWYRFQLRFGIGAVVAVFHDFFITLGLFAIMNYEFNLPTIAAFLTLVGYSVNDTVVIFDRVRENRDRFKRMPLEDVMNLSINQTLSRTVLTSGTTLLVVACLFVAGGEVLRGFAFVLMVGVFIGTYSSVFVASPFALLWEQMTASKRQQKATKVQTV
ncbi:MAG: protein translocase subunit SecF [Thermoanaerobaculia bacterium]|nr:protein translocase subunit SecF [Thermoanaerobaculia bacterium]